MNYSFIWLYISTARDAVSSLVILEYEMQAILPY